MRKIFCAGFSMALLAVFVPCCYASASVQATAFKTAEVRHYHLHRPAVQEMYSVVNFATLKPAAEKSMAPRLTTNDRQLLQPIVLPL